MANACWSSSLALWAASERYVPQFCRPEVDAFLRCGILAAGFARVCGQECRQGDVVAFSCKGRGFCPSCGARHMAAMEAHLVDHVIPDAAPVRHFTHMRGNGRARASIGRSIPLRS